MPDFPSDALEEALARVEADEQEVIAIAAEMLQAYGGAIYMFDFLAIAAINRSLALSSGFRLLIREQNLISAGAILRLQLDTALRFFAGYLVYDPHDFTLQVLEGKQINRMKDRSGHRMTDSHLVTEMAKEHPWVKEVYDRASGYVHMSGIHILSAVSIVDGEAGVIGMKASSHDQPLPEDLYIDVVTTFRQCTRILVLHIEGWTLTKDNPEAVALLKKIHQQTAHGDQT